jgi:hypothetical protein
VVDRIVCNTVGVVAAGGARDDPKRALIDRRDLVRAGGGDVQSVKFGNCKRAVDVR